MRRSSNARDPSDRLYLDVNLLKDGNSSQRGQTIKIHLSIEREKEDDEQQDPAGNDASK